MGSVESIESMLAAVSLFLKPKSYDIFLTTCQLVSQCEVLYANLDVRDSVGNFKLQVVNLQFLNLIGG